MLMSKKKVKPWRSVTTWQINQWFKQLLSESGNSFHVLEAYFFHFFGVIHEDGHHFWGWDEDVRAINITFFFFPFLFFLSLMYIFSITFSRLEYSEQNKNLNPHCYKYSHYGLFQATYVTSPNSEWERMLSSTPFRCSRCESAQEHRS